MDDKVRRDDGTETFVVEFRQPGAAASVEDLARWLDDDEDLRGQAAVRMRGPDPGEQGGVAEAVVVTGPPSDGLADSLADWLARRALTHSVHVQVTASSGVQFVGVATGRAEGLRLAGRLRAFVAGAGHDRTGIPLSE